MANSVSDPHRFFFRIRIQAKISMRIRTQAKISMRIRIQANIAVQINIQIRGKCLGPSRNIDSKQPELHLVQYVPQIFSKLCHILLATTRTTPSTDYVFPTYRILQVESYPSFSVYFCYDF
jgi:hypothetical protein